MSITHKENRNTQRFPSIPVGYRSSVTIFCVWHNTVQQNNNNVPLHHTTCIFSRTELRPHRFWSHSSKTTVKHKIVPVYTMNTYRGSTVTLHWSVTSAEKTAKRSASCISCFIAGELSHIIHWTTGQMGPRFGLMFWVEGKSLASAKKQTTCGPASRLSLYWLSYHWK